MRPHTRVVAASSAATAGVGRRVEGGVRTLAVGERCEGLGHRGTRGDAGETEECCDLPAPGAGFGDDDGGGTLMPGDQCGEDPDRAGAVDGDGGPDLHAGASDRVDSDGERLREGRHARVDAVGHRVQHRGRQGHVLGHSAGGVDAVQAQVSAHVCEPVLAGSALTTADQGFDGDEGPDGGAGGGGPLDPAGDLVTHDQRRARPGVLAVQDRQVRATDPVVGDLDQGPALGHVGHRDVSVLHLVGALPYGGLHAGHLMLLSGRLTWLR